MVIPLAARVGIDALSKVEAFMDNAQQLKALTVQLKERRQRESGFQRALARQIERKTQLCNDLAAQHAQLGPLWDLTQAELRLITGAAAEPQRRP